MHRSERHAALALIKQHEIVFQPKVQKPVKRSLWQRLFNRSK